MDKLQKPEEINEPPQVEADMPLPLSVEPKKAPNPPESSSSQSFKGRLQNLRNWYVSHKKISIPASVIAILIILSVIPLTRYPLASFFINKDFSIQVVDSVSHTPVSGADVVLGSGSGAITDGNGRAKFHVPVGYSDVEVHKNYYNTYHKIGWLVPIRSQKTVPVIELVATGRQVKVTIDDVVSKKPLADTDIKVLDITAKTDSSGNALLVLPVGSASQKATLSRSGYNNSTVTIKISDTDVAQNNFNLTPSGKVYFLSKLSGKIDVVKTDLDGQNRQTVLAGTGKEDGQSTVLLASRDWKYLALLSRRDSSLAKLFLIETATDKVTAVDEGNANFQLIGWSNDTFVYQVDRLGYAQWQPKQHALKSYDAVNKKINVLDETDATGDGTGDSGGAHDTYEAYSGVYIVGQRVVYAKSWNTSYFDNTYLSGKSLAIYSISAAGGTKAVHKTFSYDTHQIVGSTDTQKLTYIQSFPANPGQIDYQVYEKSTEPKYYIYASGQVTEKPLIKQDFDNYYSGTPYNTYLASPSGNATFWSESRDGKNTLFVGDATGSNGKQVAALSDYQTYGWYTDNYLLASKNGSELFIFSKDGIKKDTDALKITDYHKPAFSYPGYGGGYGGT